MRKQNSTFQTAFISEAGSELANNDYFAFVELEQYACYVIADGLSDLPDPESARLATQTVILSFQEHPSIQKAALLSYLKEADKALCEADSRKRLKASIIVIVTDYAKIRYACAGNTRLRLYREGNVKEASHDMSLGRDMGREKQLSEDVLAKHEERNNLYTYLGQGFGFEPFVSRKIKLENGDILAMYTRGIWEHLDGGELNDVFSEAKDNPLECLDNIEDLLLSRQPEQLENYTFAAVFVNKVFLDPNRKRRIKKIITITAAILAVIAVISLVLWIFNRQRQKQIEEMNRRYLNTIEYIQDNNYLRADEECSAALEAAEKLKDKKRIAEISDYQKLIEAVNVADESYSGEKYEEAQTNYVTAKERSRYADHLADEYIEKQLDYIANYLSVFDYIHLGDTLTAGGDYERAEEKYLAAKSLATRTYFEAGRKDAIESLEAMYTVRNKAEESDTQEAKVKASNETGAAGLATEGDKAFAEGDYEGAKAYYAMALEKYQELGDTAHAELLTTKISSSGQKSEVNQQKALQAEAHVMLGEEQEVIGELLEAKKQYLFAKNLFRELKMDDRVTEMDGLIEVLETSLDKDKADKESIAEEKESIAAEKESMEAESQSIAAESQGKAAENPGMAEAGQSKAAKANIRETKKADATGPGQEIAN